MLLEELILRIPSETASHVDRTRRRLNTAIREALRQETALRLRRESSQEQDSFDSVAVPVSLVPGLPTALRHREMDQNYVLAAKLAPYRHTLTALRDASRTVARVLDEELPEGALDQTNHFPDETLGDATEIAEALLRLARVDDPKWNFAKWVLEVNEDVLGTYEWRSDYGTDPKPRVSLFWGVIGLLAQVLGVSVEGLTGVVLAHELAHAYTHLGLDIDGEAWDTEAFEQATLEVVEGLAQYYTLRICHRIRTQAPDAAAVYQTLLTFQPKAYKVAEKWRAYQPEEVRYAMLHARRSGVATLKDFQAALKDAQRGLGRKRPQPAEA